MDCCFWVSVCALVSNMGIKKKMLKWLQINATRSTNQTLILRVNIMVDRKIIFSNLSSTQELEAIYLTSASDYCYCMDFLLAVQSVHDIQRNTLLVSQPIYRFIILPLNINLLHLVVDFVPIKGNPCLPLKPNLYAKVCSCQQLKIKPRKHLTNQKSPAFQAPAEKSLELLKSSVLPP